MRAVAGELRRRARGARTELRALAVALGDPRTPWYARAIAGVTVGLAASPIDPIPDVIPVVGYLDDLVFVPVGVYLAGRAIPGEVLAEAQEEADDAAPAAGRRLGAALVVGAWLLAAALLGWLLVAAF